jgi:hypothetical protein
VLDLMAATVRVLTEKDAFAVPEENALGLRTQLRRRAGGRAVAEKFERAMAQPEPTVRLRLVEKEHVYGALRDWLQVGTVDEIGQDLMQLMTELETADLRDERRGR